MKQNKSQPDEKLEEIEVTVPELKEQKSENDMEKALEAAQAEAKKHWELALRTQAELENAKKRAQKDIESAHKFGMEQLIKALIPVMDSLDQGLNIKKGTDPHANAIHEGMEMTAKMLSDTLKRFNVEVVDPLHQVFDPLLHEAMLMQPSDEVPPNHVLQVIQKGYVLHGRLIRPARVIVAEVINKA